MSCGFTFAGHFFNISRRFNFANWLPRDFSRGFIFENLSFINILIFSWFVIQIVVCESRNSCPNFSIFQIVLFGYKRLNSRLFDTGWPLKIRNDFSGFFRGLFRGFSRFFRVVSINRIVISSPVIFSWLLTLTNQHHSCQ